MMRGILRLLVVVGVWWFWTPNLPAQVPPLIRYQGTLVDVNNVPLEGAYNLTFRLYEASSGGTALWVETQPSITISRGVFSVLLGQTTSLTVPFDKDYWLSTQVGTDAEMSPRQRLTSVPYAYRAKVAEVLDTTPPKFTVDTTGTLPNGLVAYWKLDEASGTRMDSVGANNLTDNNTVTQATGKIDQAGQFTAANSKYLSISDNADLSTGDIDFTLCAWVYLDTDTRLTIAGKWGNLDSKREYLLGYKNQSGGAGNFDFAVVGASQGTVTSTFANPTTGQWYFVVGWHDSVANTLNIQVNNGTVNSVSYSIGSKDTTSPFVIGNDSDNNFYWNGRIDEVGFWKRVLTAPERADLYNNGAGNTYSPGKAANPWLQMDAGIAYTHGRVGIGTLNVPNILSVQQGSATDPIADSWTVYPSDRQHKHVIQPARAGYLTQLKATPLYEWTRTPMASDEEAREEFRKSQPTAEELEAKKRTLIEAKAVLPKFTTKRVGMVIDDANVPSEVLAFNPDGTKAGIDLLAYLGYLHAALKETALKLDELESRLPKK